MGYCTLILAALPLLGLTAFANTTTNHVLAWGYWHGGRASPCCNQGWNGEGSCCGDDGGSQCCSQGDQGTDAYNAGIADAVYDHQNNLSYHPSGNCLPCHSQEYWNNFREGYEHQWNIYQ